MQLIKGKKVKVTTSRKRKKKDRNLVGREKSEDVDVVVEEQNGELMIVVRLLSVFTICHEIIIHNIMKSETTK